MRIPSLDGLRAVSIVLVLMAHVVGMWTGVAGDVGSLGVRIFFVISGFLMTVLLEREFDRNGRISLSGFLARRAFRIVPAFAVYVAAIGAMSAAGLLVVRSGDLLSAATFTMNYHAPRSWYLGHLWSLSVEAQFYLSWAAVRILVGRSRMLAAAVGALAVAPAARVAIYVFAPEWRWAIGEAFPTIVDALATGGLLAMLQRRLAANRAYVGRLRPSAAGAAILAGIVALNAAMPRIAFSYTVGETLLNVLIALMIHRLMLFPERAAARVLNARAVAAFGALSYSLYLWQQLFLNRQSASFVAAFPLNVALAIATALVAYLVVERPMLAIGGRLGDSRRRQPDRREAIGLEPHAALS